jgi:acyl carrier protein
MKKSDFFLELKDALMSEDDEINENTEIHLTSLTTLSIIAFIDENFDKQVKSVDLKSVRNVSRLIDLIGRENVTN